MSVILTLSHNETEIDDGTLKLHGSMGTSDIAITYKQHLIIDISLFLLHFDTQCERQLNKPFSAL